jgi:hypothetical protein
MAMIGKQDIFAEIVIMSIKRWPASQTKFLLAWKDRLRIYKELNAGIDIDDLQKTTLLQVAAQGPPSLARVKDDADILSTQLNKSLTFDEYYWLLESAAQQFDSLTERNAAGTRKAHRQTLRNNVFEHHTPPNSADDFSVLDMSYYDVMRTSQQQHKRTTPLADQRPRVRLADDQWKDLEDKARTLWKSISAPNKAIILRYSTMRHPDAQTTQQVHFITSQCLEPDAAEFMVSRAASYHLGEHPFPEDTPTTASDATWDASTMTGSVNRTNLKTGDPRKMLSNRLAKPPTGAVASPSTEVTIGGHIVGSFIADDDVLRFQAHNTNVMYRVSRLTHIEPGIDMVNRGANGGVAGSNVASLAAICVLSSDIPHALLTSKGMTTTAPPTYLSLPVPTLSTLIGVKSSLSITTTPSLGKAEASIPFHNLRPTSNLSTISLFGWAASNASRLPTVTSFPSTSSMHFPTSRPELARTMVTSCYYDRRLRLGPHLP